MPLLLLSKPVGASVEAGASAEEEAERETVKVASARLRKVTTTRSRMACSPFFSFIHRPVLSETQKRASGECGDAAGWHSLFFRTYSLLLFSRQIANFFITSAPPPRNRFFIVET